MSEYCKYYKENEEVSYDGGMTWEATQNYRKGALYESYSYDCGYVISRWVDVPDGYECSGTTKMTQQKKQVSHDGGATWEDSSPLETRAALPVLEYYSADCGYIPLYQWAAIRGDFECSGTTKMTKEKLQVSYDNGTTWQDVTPLETRAALPVLEYFSADCGAPSTPGDYLTYIALEDTYICSSERGLFYSLDGGNTWYDVNDYPQLINTYSGEKSYYLSTLIPSGSRVLLKANHNHDNSAGCPRININSTGRFSVSGNPLSVIYSDNFPNKVDKEIYQYAFQTMFADNLHLVSAENLIIPRKLSYGCCFGMFQNCVSLVAAPELPSKTLTPWCYCVMFRGCRSLTTAPELPAMVMTDFCYDGMFAFCTSLVAAPELLARTLAQYCYCDMFYGCTSLTTAPELPVTTLAFSCYQGMFSDCTSLTVAPELPATTLAERCYYVMFKGCTSLIDPPELLATTLANNCYQQMFEGCSFTNLCDYELNAMTLANGCYQGMFQYCTSLTVAPRNLPAVHLADGCYESMFKYCTSLIRAPRKIDVYSLGPESCNNMFYNCCSLVEPCNLYVTHQGGISNFSYMNNMYANCSQLDHFEFVFHLKGGMMFYINENWLSNTKKPFYLLTDRCTWGYTESGNSSACTSVSSHYEYNSLTKYWTEVGWSTNSPATAFEDEIITLTTPIENITSIKIAPYEIVDNRYIIMKSMDNSIEIMVNGNKFEVVSGESFYMNEILGDEGCDWVTPAYYSWGVGYERWDMPKPLIEIFVNIDLYKHFGKKFYIETINNDVYRTVTGTPKFSIEENIPSILSYMVDIVSDLESECGVPIYKWNTNGVIIEDNKRYEQEIYQKTYNNGSTWINVSPTEERKSNIILERQFRWINLDPSTDYYCNGTTKMYKQQKQMSYDGINWKDVVPAEYRSGDVAQTESTDCGYMPPLPEGTKWIATYTNEVTSSAECDSTSAITQGEVTKKENLLTFSIGLCVTDLGDFAFANSSLTNITIPNSVTSIGWGTFRGCSGLTSITIPNSVTSIGDFAFEDCSGLTSIEIPSGVTSIGWGTFTDCFGLTSCTIPNAVTSIDVEAFSGCTSLSTINIPNSVTTIGQSAFSGAGLRSITIPNSVTSIDNGVFSNCTSLTSINIPNSVTSIDFYAFKGCASLTSVTIPNAVTSIGMQAFYHCWSLSSVTIGSGVTSIGENTFDSCRSLTSVIIPSGVTSIGAQAFITCDGLTSITVNAPTPPSLGNRAFFGTNNCPILVPAASLEAYKSATNWSTYASRIQAIP